MVEYTISNIKVLVAEDSPTIRRYLVKIIENSPNLEVVGEAIDGQEAIQLAETLQPDVISMDIRMPEVDGLEATRHIMAHHPTPIVIVSGLLEQDITLSFKRLRQVH